MSEKQRAIEFLRATEERMVGQLGIGWYMNDEKCTYGIYKKASQLLDDMRALRKEIEKA